MPQRTYFNHVAGVAVLALLFGAGMTQAQTTGSSSSTMQGAATSGTKSTSSKPLSRADQEVLRDIAQSNLAEIEAAKLALSQSKNDQVKSFAQKMIDDHTQAQKDVEQLAQAKGVTLPTEPDSKHKAAAKKLSSLEGDKFDKQYMSQGGLSDHRETHRLLERAQSRASDPDVKALVAKIEPVVNQHLTMAQDVTGAKTSASGSSGSMGSSMSGPGKSGSATSGPAKSGVSGPSGDTGSGKQ
jgi:putative membrane protein